MTDPSKWLDSREFWPGKRVCVTGGAGFLGSYVVEKLRRRDVGEVFVPCFPDYDLTQAADIRRMLGEARPDLVIHLAARVGGIPLRFASGTNVGANREHPAEFFYDNLMMGVQLIHESWLA